MNDCNCIKSRKEGHCLSCDWRDEVEKFLKGRGDRLAVLIDLQALIREIALKAKQEGYKEGLKDGEGTKNGVRRYLMGYTEGAREEREKIKELVKKLEVAKPETEADERLYEVKTIILEESKTALSEALSQESKPSCHEQGKPHDYQVEDFSGGEDGQAYLICRVCGKRKTHE